MKVELDDKCQWSFLSIVNHNIYLSMHDNSQCELRLSTVQYNLLLSSLEILIVTFNICTIGLDCLVLAALVLLCVYNFQQLLSLNSVLYITSALLSLLNRNPSEYF